MRVHKPHQKIKETYVSMVFNVFRISLNASFWGGFEDLDFLGLFGGFDPLLAGLVDRISVFKL